MVRYQYPEKFDALTLFYIQADVDTNATAVGVTSMFTLIDD